MKNHHKVFRTFLLSVLITLTFSCKKDAEIIPLPTWEHSTFTDSRDGKTYNTIKIDDQEWMTENLSFKTGIGSWYYADDVRNGIKYGVLYTQEAASQAAPAGWHVASDLEWKQLEIKLGMSQDEADRIGSRGTNEGNKLKTLSGWLENGNGTDDIHFSVVPAGFRSNAGNFLLINWHGNFWTSTPNDNTTGWIRSIIYNHSTIERNYSFKGDGYSVRCIKD